jgi:hypothetical protein
MRHLIALVELAFARGRATLTSDEWEELLGRRPANLQQRLCLLARLSRSVQEPVPVELNYQFKPKDIGDHFGTKWALLPDGVTFALKLLLQTGRGRKAARPEADVLKNLPDAVLLDALAHAFATERKTGAAVPDRDFGRLLQRALLDLGVPIAHPPDGPELRNLRARFNDEKGGKRFVFFPSQRERQSAYADGKPAVARLAEAVP